jgi:response regulator RpfG family c-di-GMP phosphodiesterase
MPTHVDEFPVAVTLVDDEPSVLDLLTRAARAWDFECQSATSAEQAVALLEQQLTPIVVTDLRMPGRGGLWLVREVQRRWPAVTVIVVTTGEVDTDAVGECLSAGAQHYFLKPINLDEFRHALEAARRSSDRHREGEKLRRLVQRQGLRVRATYVAAIVSLVRTLEARDPYTLGHSLRVRRYCLRLARALGLDDRQQRRLALAARLHDIGKVGVPEAVLHKEGPLSDAELAQVRAHPVIGERILTPTIRSRLVLAAVRAHHERHDGRGYPDGLAGEHVPLLARLLAVADCYDALTSLRPYRQPLGRGEALEVIRAGTGTQFDPGVCRAFLGLMQPGAHNGITLR